MPVAAPDHTALVALAPGGTLRVGVNIANPALVRAEADGTLRGTAIDLAHRVAQVAGLPLAFVRYPSAGSMFAALDDDAWDIAFMATDPARAARLHFTPPYLTIEARYAVPAGSPLHDPSEVDRDGLRVATSRGAAYDLHLQRALRHATRVEYDSPAASFAGFARGEADAVAGVRQALEAFMAERRGYRMLTGAIVEIGQAIAVPVERRACAAFLDALVAGEKLSA